MAWTRAELVEHVDQLHLAYQGREFVDELARFARESLSQDERDLLQDVLLERGAQEEARRAAQRRLAEPGWFHRMLRRAEERAERLRGARRPRK